MDNGHHNGPLWVQRPVVICRFIWLQLFNFCTKTPATASPNGMEQRHVLMTTCRWVDHFICLECFSCLQIYLSGAPQRQTLTTRCIDNGPLWWTSHLPWTLQFVCKIHLAGTLSRLNPTSRLSDNGALSPPFHFALENSNLSAERSLQELHNVRPQRHVVITTVRCGHRFICLWKF